ncbi:hypothetical protein [Emticicia sp. SJ17W-69]
MTENQPLPLILRTYKKILISLQRLFLIHRLGKCTVNITDFKLYNRT